MLHDDAVALHRRASCDLPLNLKLAKLWAVGEECSELWVVLNDQDFMGVGLGRDTTQATRKAHSIKSLYSSQRTTSGEI